MSAFFILLFNAEISRQIHSPIYKQFLYITLIYSSADKKHLFSPESLLFLLPNPTHQGIY